MYEYKSINPDTKVMEIEGSFSMNVNILEPGIEFVHNKASMSYIT